MDSTRVRSIFWGSEPIPSIEASEKRPRAPQAPGRRDPNMSISKLIALVPVAALAVACGGGGEAAPEAAAPEAPAEATPPADAPAADAPAADAPAADAPAGGDAKPAEEKK